MMKKIFSAGILIAFVSMTPASAFAVGSGGFENASFSAKSLAMGNAVTATPDEPAAISYNPAGIADLPGVQVQGDASFISLMTFKANNVTGDTRSSGTLNLVPTGYVTINPGKIFGDRLGLGVGFDSPFGLMNKYRSSDPAVHYTGWRNYLKMYTIKPTAACKITDKISIGGGPMWYRVSDFGGIQAYPNNLVTMAGGVNTSDGQVRLNTSGNHWGWQMGTLVKLTPKHRLGYYFRSPVVVKTSGLAKVENSDFSGIGGQGLHNFETGVHTKLSLPMNMTWAYAYQPTGKTHYEADFSWSHWHTNRRLYFVTDPAADALDNTVLNNIRMSNKDWGDGFGIQLAASHKLTKKLTLRGGSRFYWTPVPKTSFAPSVADANHLAISLGAGYEINKHLTADFCYYNSFYFRRRINNSVAENAALLNSSVDGTYTTYSQAFTVSLTVHWDDIFPRASGNKGREIEVSSIDMKPVA
ncbi:MAG: outer membrane protein transport protein [Patescibacteria group bacterium]